MSPAYLFCCPPAQGTYGRSFPPVTMSPSLRVVYMVKTGPLWALATTRTRKCSLHTYTSPLTAPVKVKLFWRRNGTAEFVWVKATAERSLMERHLLCYY